MSSETDERKSFEDLTISELRRAVHYSVLQTQQSIDQVKVAIQFEQNKQLKAVFEQRLVELQNDYELFSQIND